MKYIYDYEKHGKLEKIDKFILLSKSPRRKELLKFLNPEVLNVDIDERSIEDKYMREFKDDEFLIRAAKTCAEISKGKSDIKLLDNTMYISSDTMVVFKDEIYNKPKDMEDASRMFRSYFGNIHHVISAVTLRMKDYLDVFYTISEVEFIKYYDELEDGIVKYLNEENVMDKAGAYGIQDLDSRFIKKISGDINTIIGISASEVSYRIFNK